MGIFQYILFPISVSYYCWGKAVLRSSFLFTFPMAFLNTQVLQRKCHLQIHETRKFARSSMGNNYYFPGISQNKVSLKFSFLCKLAVKIPPVKSSFKRFVGFCQVSTLEQHFSLEKVIVFMENWRRKLIINFFRYKPGHLIEHPELWRNPVSSHPLLTPLPVQTSGIVKKSYAVM